MRVWPCHIPMRLLLIGIARGISLSTPVSTSFAANGTRGVDRLAASVAAATTAAANHPTGSVFQSSDEKNAVASALKAGVEAYHAEGRSKAVAAQEADLESKANATRQQIAASDKVAKEVEKGQMDAAKQALGALKDAELHSPVGTLLGDRARELESKIVAAQATAAKELDALDKVRKLAEKKAADVGEAEKALDEVRRQKTQTEKEAEMAEQIAREKRADVEAIEKKEADAERKLDDARNEAEAVSEMVERKKQNADSTEQELAAQAREARETAAAAKEPVANATVNQTAKASSDSSELSKVRQENEALRREKEQLKKQLEQLDAPKETQKLQEENSKLATEKEQLEQELAEKLLAKGLKPAAVKAEVEAEATPAEVKQNLRKKLVPVVKA